MDRKLILLDVDGTITGRQGTPASAAEAIRRARMLGHKVVLFTGRPYNHTDKSVLEIGFDGAICTMGAYITAEGHVLCDKSIPGEMKDAVVAAARAHNLCSNYEYRNGIAFDRTRPLHPVQCKLQEIFGGRGLETDRNIDAPDFRFEKVCVWATGPDSDIPGFTEAVAPYVSLTGSKGDMAEYSAKGVDPAESVRAIMTYFCEPRFNTYAVGDSINDMPFLSCAGHTAAMGEACDEMKQQVEFVTTGLYEDGIANALKHFGLTERKEDHR